MHQNRTDCYRQRLQHRLRQKWLAWVAVLDNKLGLQHCATTAMLKGNDYGSVCLLRSLMRHLSCFSTTQAGHTTLVLMVLHDSLSPVDRYLQAVFTAQEMRHHMQTQTVLADVHMQREIESRLDTAPCDHVVIVHVQAQSPLSLARCQTYKLSQPHNRWNDAPVVHFEQRWFHEMARIVVRDV